jgi:hypothetical protein
VIVFLFLSLLLMPTGGVLILMGMWDRTPDAPSVSGGSLKRLLVPIWKQKSWFKTPAAYRKCVWGYVLFSASFTLNLVYSLIKVIQDGWR